MTPACLRVAPFLLSVQIDTGTSLELLEMCARKWFAFDFVAKEGFYIQTQDAGHGQIWRIVLVLALWRGRRSRETDEESEL